MKTTIKITSIIASLILMTGACGCSLVLPQGNNDGDKTQTEDALCGTFIVFYDGGQAITADDFADDEAIKIYFGKTYYEENSESYYWQSFCGRDVFSDVIYNNNIKELDDKLTGREVSITASLCYTDALADCTMHTYGIYYDEDERTYYTADLNVDDTLSVFGNFKRSQSIKLYDENSQEISYDFTIEINLKKTYSVSQINIIEFDEENNSIKKTENYLENEYNASQECSYVIVEEIATDDTEEMFTRRTLVEKGEDNIGTFEYYLPDDYGLTSRQQLKINFES